MPSEMPASVGLQYIKYWKSYDWKVYILVLFLEMRGQVCFSRYRCAESYSNVRAYTLVCVISWFVNTNLYIYFYIAYAIPFKAFLLAYFSFCSCENKYAYRDGWRDDSACICKLDANRNYHRNRMRQKLSLNGSQIPSQCARKKQAKNQSPNLFQYTVFMVIFVCSSLFNDLMAAVAKMGMTRPF